MTAMNALAALPSMILPVRRVDAQRQTSSRDDARREEDHLAGVDWSKTRAWGAGGYYARIFYNVKGREPQGTIAPGDAAAFEAELTQGLRGIRGPAGESLNVDVRVPKAIYRQVRGDSPDLMVYFANAAWRSAGTVGYDTLYLAENDTGPDDSVHSFDGIYAISGPQAGRGASGPTERLIDIGPTILDLLGVPVPPEVQGRPIAAFR